MSVPPPRISLLWSRWADTVPFGTYRGPGRVPFPLGAVDEHSTTAAFPCMDQRLIRGMA